MRKWVHRIRALITRSLFYDTNNDLENTVLVAGSARSGTTWLAELINQNNEYRLIFEPFLGEKVPAWKPYELRHFNATNIQNIDLNNDLHYILSGSIRSPWADSLNLKITCDKRIVKAVRINLLLPYIAQEFPEIKIVFIHRNPFDVISSRLFLDWEDHLGSILKQPSFITKYFPGKFEYIKSLVDPLEKQAAFWVLENKVILSKEHAYNNMVVVNYALLNQGNSEELDKVSKLLNARFRYPKRYPSQSVSTRRKKVFSEGEKTKIQSILDRLT